MADILFKYSDLFEDDGGFEKVEQDFKRLGETIKSEATNLSKQISIVNPNDSSKVQELEKKLNELSKSYDKLKISKENVSKARKKASELSKKELIALEEERKAVNNNKKEARAIARLKQAQAGSIEELRAKLAVVTIEWANLSEAERENGARGQRLTRVKTELTSSLRELERATGDNRRGVGDYANEVKRAIRELQEEDRELNHTIKTLKEQQSALQKGGAEWLQYEKRIQQAQTRLSSVNSELGNTSLPDIPSGGSGGGSLPDLNGLVPSGGGGGIAGSIGGAVSALGPIGLAVGGLITGIGAVGSAFLELEKRFSGIRKEVSKITGLVGSELEKVTVNTVALVDTFDVDQNEAIRAQNVLMKNFGETADGALGIIESGFLSGANASGELVDSILEYSSQIKDAGGDANTLVKILDKSGKAGIFSDKGIDVVKEFGLRIREQADATSGALNKAFGKEFTKDLFAGINDGSISSVDALARVSEKLNETTLPANELQTVIADVFGSQGEDVGLDYLKSLKDINKETGDLVDLTNPLIRQQKKQLELNKDLAEAQNRLTKRFEGAGGALSNFGTKLKIGFFNIADQFIEKAQDFGENVSNAFSFDDPILQSAGLKETIKDLIPFVDQLGFSFLELSEAEEVAIVNARLTNEVLEAGTDFVKEQARQYNNLVTAIQDDNITKEEQIELTNRLKDAFPGLIDDLIDINGAITDEEELRKRLNRSIAETAVTRAKESLVAKQIDLIAEKQLDLLQKRVAIEQKIKDGFSLTDAFDYSFGGEDNIISLSEAIKELSKESEQAKMSLSLLGTDGFTSDLTDQLEEIAGLFDGTEAQIYGDQLDKDLKNVNKLQTRLEKLRVAISSAETDEDRTVLIEQQRKLNNELKSAEKILGTNNAKYRELLGLSNGINEELERSGFGGTSSNESDDKKAQRKKALEFDISDEIRQKKIDNLDEERRKEIENLQFTYDKKIKQLEDLKDQQQKFNRDGLISDEVLNSRLSEINELESLYEEEKIKDKLKINQKYEELLRTQKLNEIRTTGEIELTEFIQSEIAKGTAKDKIDKEVFNKRLEQLRFELQTVESLGGIEIEKKKELLRIQGEINTLVQSQTDLNQSDRDRLQKAVSDGRLQATEREINENLDLIKEGSLVEQKIAIEKLKELNEEKFRLKRQAIEKETEILLRGVEEGSTKELAIEEERKNKLLALKTEEANSLESINDQIVDNQATAFDKLSEALTQITEELLKRLEESAEKEIEVTEKKIDTQQSAIDAQRERAEQGQSNSLAFELEQLAKKEKELIEAQKRLERRQKISSLYASYQGYASNGEEGAIGKVLKDFAILEAISASFGSGKDPVSSSGNSSNSRGALNAGVFYGETHAKRGQGINAWVENGEGILSTQEMQNLGSDNWFSLRNMLQRGSFNPEQFSNQRKSFEGIINNVKVDNNNKLLESKMDVLISEIQNIPNNSIETQENLMGFVDLVLKTKTGNREERNTFRVRKS